MKHKLQPVRTSSPQSERELFYLLTLGGFCAAEEKGLHLCFMGDADFRPED